MCDVSNSRGPNSVCQTPGQSGDVGDAFTGQSFVQDLKVKANSVPITTVFLYYGIRLDEFNYKTTCPFPRHKGGKERTPSFTYYNYSNSFYCYGCGTGGGPVNFVMNMEGLSPKAAAQKVIDLFGKKIGEIDVSNYRDFSNTLRWMLKLSTAIREFRQEFLDEESQAFIEEVSFTFDKLYASHKLEEDGLTNFVQKLIEVIDSYKCK